MHWYGGSIAEAVTLSKQKNAIFVVFVEGDNDLSVEMAATIDDTDVLNRLSDQSNFLAIKLKSGSPNYNYFAQIFKDKQPSPTGAQPAAQEPVQPSTSSTNIHGSTDVKDQTVNFVQAETAALVSQTAEAPKQVNDDLASGSPPPKIPKTAQETKPLTPDDMECDGDVCVRRASKADEPGPTFFTQLFTTMILEPSQTLLVWLRTRLFPPPATSPRTPRAPSPAPPAPPGGVRRRGNIHRLPSDRAPDDDNNTWNGNSTQQM
ncbi:hypothetical protein HF086_014458 [Spodoptera exigua]|uniref:Uncharacterized protein n=1 Tax=Spodoptera exigua TaxID=7107 RepID=A0A922MAJ6_SPOEX|nr:hypothetical protein HF086_014458 [Spodoptera exigua]